MNVSPSVRSVESFGAGRVVKRASEIMSETDTTPRWKYPGILVREITGLMKREWHARTRFGKVLYPLWVLWGIYLWAAFLLFAGFVLLAGGIVTALRWSPSPYLPDVYNDERD